MDCTSSFSGMSDSEKIRIQSKRDWPYAAGVSCCHSLFIKGLEMNTSGRKPQQGVDREMRKLRLIGWFAVPGFA